MDGIETLDRPVWSSLNSGWSALAEGDGRALRLNQDYGPFGAAGDESPDSLKSLEALIPSGGEIWVVQRPAVIAPEGTVIAASAPVRQMIAEQVAPVSAPVDYVPLGEKDAEEMLALALMTEPGPFAALTHRLGRFIGVKRGAKLIAMAGERMHIPGFREVSGVCTHPGYRGQGIAAALTVAVSERILAEGEMPFLHTYAANEVAIALYERLGFRIRAPMNKAVLKRLS